jgi:hypothetical protein
VPQGGSLQQQRALHGGQRAEDLERQQQPKEAGSRAGDALRSRRAARSAGQGATGDILYVLDRQLNVADVSVIHPGAASHRAVASRTDGATEAKRDAEKLAHYWRHGDANYKLVPFAVETLGRLGRP